MGWAMPSMAVVWTSGEGASATSTADSRSMLWAWTKRESEVSRSKRDRKIDSTVRSGRYLSRR